MRSCEEPGCDRAFYGNGRCRRHYDMARRQRPPRVTPPPVLGGLASGIALREYYNIQSERTQRAVAYHAAFTSRIAIMSVLYGKDDTG